MLKNIFAFLKSRVFLINLGIAIIALPLLVWIVLAWMGSYTHHNSFEIVPDFKNLKVTDLDNFINDKNVGYEIIDSIWDPKLQKGIVLRQDPDPGDSVKGGRVIYLYVSAVTPPTVNMPKLEDLSARQAMAVAQSYGLIPKIKNVPDPCDGCVVRQTYKEKRIEPGTPILKGETITIEVGEGQDKSGDGFPVPNLIGMNFRAARGKMIDLGLEWVVIADPGVKDTLNATVYSQDPASGNGARLIPGAMIDLRVSNDKSKANNDSLNP